MKKVNLVLEIIIDTREQVGTFYFKSYADVTTVKRKVESGDYTCAGYEHIVTVDRKFTTNEIYLNLTSDFKRFSKELERMRDIEFCYFVCCFPYSYLQEFPKNSTIPEYRWKFLKVKGSFLRKRIKDIEEEYTNIKFIFCNNQIEAEDITYQILKEHCKEDDGSLKNQIKQ